MKIHILSQHLDQPFWKELLSFFIRLSRDGSYYVIGYGGWVSTQVSVQ